MNPTIQTKPIKLVWIFRSSGPTKTKPIRTNYWIENFQIGTKPNIFVCNAEVTYIFMSFWVFSLHFMSITRVRTKTHFDTFIFLSHITLKRHYTHTHALTEPCPPIILPPPSGCWRCRASLELPPSLHWQYNFDLQTSSQ